MTDLPSEQQPEQDEGEDADEASRPQPATSDEPGSGRRAPHPATGGDGAAGAGGPEGFGT